MSIKKNFFAPLASGLGATRRAAMLLLVMMLTTVTAWATTTSTINVGGTDYTLFTGFTATSGTNVSALAYNYPNFVDGNLSNKWRVIKSHEDPNAPAGDFNGGTEDPAYVEFHADAPIIPKGYVLTYDNSVNENWKPTSWALKAKLSESDNWTTIHSSNSSLGNGSRFVIACNNNGNNQYQYFRFEIYDVGATRQSVLNELEFYGSSPEVYYTHLTVRDATCTETGIKQDCYQRNDGKYFTDETGTTELQESDVIAPMIPHSGDHHDATDVNIEYWQCSMCSKYFSDSGYTTEITEEQTKIYRTITIDGSISSLVTSDVSQALAGETIALYVSHLIDTSTLQVNSGSVALTNVGNGTYTFIVPAADVTVTANLLSTYSVTLPANMAIVSATNAADSNGKYISGTVIKFAASLGYEATNVSDGTNTLEPDANGIYTVTVAEADINITATTESSNTIYLARATSDFTAVDGNILIGATSHTVTIANNATITLSNVTITGGIVCAGTAEITLVGTNSVTGFSRFDPNINAIRYTAGIQVGGSGTTLTIKGNGSLTANGALNSAGIGLTRAWDVDATGGDIVIEGGTITATGNGKGAGIGTGACMGDTSDKTATLGNITIKGGTVRAIAGTDNDYPGNGIGKGGAYSFGHAVVGTITIYDGIDMVDASSISESVTYMHVENETETNVTESKTDYFTIIENGNRRIIVQKVTPTIADVPDQTYTGSEIKPEPLVMAGSLNLTKGTDYEYSYTNNTNVGTAKVTVTFKGDYASLGYVEKEFTILPSTVMVSVTGSGTVTCGDRSATDGTSFGVMSEKGASVVLTLAPTDGYAARSVEYGYTFLNENNNEVTAIGLKLPISGTTATLTVPNNMKDGTYVTMTVSFVSALVGGADESSAVALTDNTVTNFAGGWYKVENDISFDHTLNLLADTYLTIAEGKTMSVNTTSGKAIDSEYTLNVSGEGALNITTTEAYKIAVLVGNYVQTGVTVTASGYIGIRCTDSFGTLGFDNDFTFSGGQLTATGSGGDGIWADNDITLSCTNATDFIQASSYDASGTVKVADGKALTDGTEASNGMNGYSGTLTHEQITAIGGKTLHRAVTTSYVDASGTLHENVIAIPLDNTMTTLAAGWYVVNSDVDYTGTVTLSGNVKLILGDGCTMSFGKEGELLNATIMECNTHDLTIYGQSGGTGWLKAYSAQYDGIKNVNYYTQYSGNVVIYDGNNACIYAREFTILGGTLDLKSEGNADGEIVTTENINIRGGKLWAWYKGLKTNGKIILDYTNATDQIRAYSYQFQNGLEIADGKTLVDENGTIWSGTLEYYQIGFNNSTLRPFKTITLADNADNSSTISEWNGGVAEVTLSGRTLYKDGAWNTLCLPFSLSAEQIAANTDFAGATLMTMDVTKKNGFDVEDGTLYLWFKTATTIEAGVPYLVKWEKAADYEGNEANYDISNPVFESVTISNSTAQAVESSTEGLETVQMVGTYSPVSVTADDKSILFLGDANTLYYSTVDRQIRSCRAYFSVPYINGHAGAKARAFALSFDGEETTGIPEVSANSNEVKDDVWYSLDGVRLSGKPTQRGMYINKGKKILVK